MPPGGTGRVGSVPSVSLSPSLTGVFRMPSWGNAPSHASHPRWPLGRASAPPLNGGAGDPQSGRSCSESQSLCPPPPVLPASGVVGTVSPPRDPCAVTSWDSQDFQPASPVGSWLCPRRQPAGHCWLDTGCEARPQSAPMHRGCKVGLSRWPETVRWGAGGEGALSAGPAPGEGRIRASVCHAWREVSCGPVTRCRALARAPSWG